jgi:hypothetical protein
VLTSRSSVRVRLGEQRLNGLVGLTTEEPFATWCRRLIPLNDQHQLLDDLGVQVPPRMKWNDKPFLALHVDPVASLRADKNETMLKQ